MCHRPITMNKHHGWITPTHRQCQQLTCRLNKQDQSFLGFNFFTHYTQICKLMFYWLWHMRPVQTYLHQTGRGSNPNRYYCHVKSGVWYDGGVWYDEVSYRSDFINNQDGCDGCIKLFEVQGSRWFIVICATITEAVTGNEILESQAPSTVQYKKVKDKSIQLILNSFWSVTDEHTPSQWAGSSQTNTHWRICLSTSGYIQPSLEDTLCNQYSHFLIHNIF